MYIAYLNVERYCVEVMVEMGGAKGTAWKSSWKWEELEAVENAGGWVSCGIDSENRE